MAQKVSKVRFRNAVTLESMELYMKDNVWRFAWQENCYVKVYRYCLVCGYNRFTDNQWCKMPFDHEDIIRGFLGYTMTCHWTPCSQNQRVITEVLPLEHRGRGKAWCKEDFDKHSKEDTIVKLESSITIATSLEEFDGVLVYVTRVTTK
jgi:hypothetical protein